VADQILSFSFPAERFGRQLFCQHSASDRVPGKRLLLSPVAAAPARACHLWPVLRTWPRVRHLLGIFVVARKRATGRRPGRYSPARGQPSVCAQCRRCFVFFQFLLSPCEFIRTRFRVVRTQWHLLLDGQEQKHRVLLKFSFGSSIFFIFMWISMRIVAVTRSGHILEPLDQRT
jgi:hypothetical protein